LKLEKGNGAEIQNKTNEVIEKRSQMHPQGMASAGSFFINPVVNKPELLDRFEKDSGKRFSDSTIPAGWLIQEVGLAAKSWRSDGERKALKFYCKYWKCQG